MDGAGAHRTARGACLCAGAAREGAGHPTASRQRRRAAPARAVPLVVCQLAGGRVASPNAQPAIPVRRSRVAPEQCNEIALLRGRVAAAFGAKALGKRRELDRPTQQHVLCLPHQRR